MFLGFFISGSNPLGGLFVNQNLALIPGTNMPITIDNVNDSVNSSYYVNNLAGQTLQYDGYTTPILLQQVVTPGTILSFQKWAWLMQEIGLMIPAYL